MSIRRVGLGACCLCLLATCQPNQSTQPPGAARPADSAATQAPPRPTAGQPDSVVAVASPAISPGYRRYVGTVGRLPVVLELTLDDSCVGNYYYQHRGEPLALAAVRFRPGRPLVLRELANDKLTGYWRTAQPAGPVLSGTWESADGHRRLPFRLREDYASALRYEVGELAAQGSEACGVYEDQSDTASYQAAYINVLAGGASAAVRRRLQQALGPPVPEKQLQAYVEAKAEEHSCSRHGEALTVTLNQDYLFAFAVYSDDFGFGAAHPIHELGGLAYSLRTGRQLTLADLLRPGYETPLRQLITRALLTDPEYAGITRSNAWRWPNETDEAEPLAPLPGGGFILYPTGIDFQFSDYEICAYGDGMPSVTLPYAQLRPLARPNGPLAPLLQRAR